jgi:UV DNA damage endonuclease
MRIGYPCLNRTIGCTASRTFRLSSYSDNRLRDTVQENLACLSKILAFNAMHNLLFFRITSDLVPFASHRVCTFPWQDSFTGTFGQIGGFIKRHRFRISMHPDQFVLLNSPDEGVFRRSVDELRYQAQVLDLLGLDDKAKVQIHVGGVYGNKTMSTDRFVQRYELLDPAITRRLAIENDDRLYSISDCLTLSEQTGIPVIMDSFHHDLFNNGEGLGDLFPLVRKTWKQADGIPMVDYSSQEQEKRAGAHAEHIVADDFRQFLATTHPADFDIMLEIKDKERSALEALEIARYDSRLVTGDPAQE